MCVNFDNSLAGAESWLRFVDGWVLETVMSIYSCKRDELACEQFVLGLGNYQWVQASSNEQVRSIIRSVDGALIAHCSVEARTAESAGRCAALDHSWSSVDSPDQTHSHSLQRRAPNGSRTQLFAPLAEFCRILMEEVKSSLAANPAKIVSCAFATAMFRLPTIARDVRFATLSSAPIANPGKFFSECLTDSDPIEYEDYEVMDRDIDELKSTRARGIRSLCDPPRFVQEEEEEEAGSRRRSRKSDDCPMSAMNKVLVRTNDLKKNVVLSSSMSVFRAHPYFSALPSNSHERLRRESSAPFYSFCMVSSCRAKRLLHS